MSDHEWIDALRTGKRVSARWGHPADLSSVRAGGKVVGYSPNPMVLIETPEGERFWWGADLTFIEDAALNEETA